MRHLLAVVAAAAVLIGATALAVGPFDDRELFVPPPDAVAEGFVREVITGRYVRAQPYLVEPMPEEELRALRARAGDPSQVEAEVVSRTDERALVTVRVASGESSEALAFALVFDGEWKIE